MEHLKNPPVCGSCPALTPVMYKSRTDSCCGRAVGSHPHTAAVMIPAPSIILLLQRWHSETRTMCSCHIPHRLNHDNVCTYVSIRDTFWKITYQYVQNWMIILRVKRDSLHYSIAGSGQLDWSLPATGQRSLQTMASQQAVCLLLYGQAQVNVSIIQTYLL